MKIALDAQLTIGTATGIGEYARGLTSALQASGADVVPLSWRYCDPWRFDRRVLWDQIGLPVQAALAGADVLHCASGTMPLVRTLPTVVTVHDVAWLHAQEHTRSYARAYFGSFSLARYRHARRVLVDSFFSRNELVRLTDIDFTRIEVVYPGVAEDIMNLVREPAEKPFILAVGTVEKRKNLEVVIRALRDISAVKLVSVGPFTPYRETCERIAHEYGVSERVFFRGYVAREELLRLYAHASVAVVPSLYEGFGYGVAQALCAGVPFIAANATSLPEVAGPGSILLDAEDVGAWKEALGHVLADGSVANTRAMQMRAAARERFSWRAAADAALAAYGKAL